MNVTAGTGVKMSCTKTPALRCVPPETRFNTTCVPVVPSRPSSSLSPSTQRQSAPAETTWRPSNVRDHCVITPVPLVGTLWLSVIRPMLRGGVAAGTARKLLRNVSLSTKTVAVSSLRSARIEAHAAADGRPRRVVGFRRLVDRAVLAVVPLFAEVAGAEEESAPVGRVVHQLDIEVA